MSPWKDPDIVPRRKRELTKEDMEKLTGKGIRQESWHYYARLMEARYQKDSERSKNIRIVLNLKENTF